MDVEREWGIGLVTGGVLVGISAVIRVVDARAVGGTSKIHEIVGKWGLSSDRVLLSNYRRKGKVEVIMEHSNE